MSVQSLTGLLLLARHEDALRDGIGGTYSSEQFLRFAAAAGFSVRPDDLAGLPGLLDSGWSGDRVLRDYVDVGHAWWMPLTDPTVPAPRGVLETTG